MHLLTGDSSVDWRSKCGAWLALSGFLLMGLFVAGCETPAQRLEASTLSAIQPGISTKEDAIRIYGAPGQTLIGERRTLMVWETIYWASPNSSPFSPSQNTLARRLSILFDEKNVILKVRHSDHQIPTTFAGGSVVLGRNFDANLLSKIKVGTTTRQETAAVLGEPAFESLDLNGDLVMDWVYTTGDIIVGQNQLRTLRVVINSADKVALVREVNSR